MRITPKENGKLETFPMKLITDKLNFYYYPSVLNVSELQA
jgi:hypothetical protein